MLHCSGFACNGSITKELERLLLEDRPFDHLKEGDSCSDGHPYKSIIEGLIENLDHNPVKELRFLDDVPLTPLAEYEWIDTQKKLQYLVHDLNEQIAFAVDTEQYSHRSYLGYTALIQVSTKERDYIIDTIAVHDFMQVLRPVFRYIFHGAINDIKWLQRDFHIYVVNLFDTLQACDILETNERSLKYLLKQYCKVEADKVYQVANWSQRPLPKAMIEYSQIDSHYLLYIAQQLVTKLKQIDDKSVAKAYKNSNSLCLNLYTKRSEITVMQRATSRITKHLKGDDTQFENRFRRLWGWRDLMARIHDESPDYVLSEEAIVHISSKQDHLTPEGIRSFIEEAGLSKKDPPDSKSTPQLPSRVIRFHFDDIHYILKDTESILDVQFLLEKYLGRDGSCPLTFYNRNLVSQGIVIAKLFSEIEVKLTKKLRSKKVSQNPFDNTTFRKSLVYNNCKVYAEDENFIGFCSIKGKDRILKDGQGVLINKDPLEIKLIKDAKVDKQYFFTQERKNICVGCGAKNKYHLHHIVPRNYKIHFPKELKDHQPNNAFLVCAGCGGRARVAEYILKNKLESEYSFLLSQKESKESESGNEKLLNSFVLGAAYVLLKDKTAMEKKNTKKEPQILEKLKEQQSQEELKKSQSQEELEVPRIPKTRLDILTKAVQEYIGATEVTEEGLKTIIEKGNRRSKQKSSKHDRSCYEKKVVDYLFKNSGEAGLLQFVGRWRSAFFEAVNPPGNSESGRRQFGDHKV